MHEDGRIFDNFNNKRNFDNMSLDFQKASNLDKIHERMMDIFPKIKFFKDVSNEDIVSREEIYSRFVIFALLLTGILSLVPLGQLIEISIITKSVKIVQPMMSKEYDPFCKFFIRHLVVIVKKGFGKFL